MKRKYRKRTSSKYSRKKSNRYSKRQKPRKSRKSKKYRKSRKSRKTRKTMMKGGAGDEPAQNLTPLQAVAAVSAEEALQRTTSGPTGENTTMDVGDTTIPASDTDSFLSATAKQAAEGASSVDDAEKAIKGSPTAIQDSLRDGLKTDDATKETERNAGVTLAREASVSFRENQDGLNRVNEQSSQLIQELSDAIHRTDMDLKSRDRACILLATKLRLVNGKLAEMQQRYLDSVEAKDGDEKRVLSGLEELRKQKAEMGSVLKEKLAERQLLRKYVEQLTGERNHAVNIITDLANQMRAMSQTSEDMHKQKLISNYKEIVTILKMHESPNYAFQTAAADTYIRQMREIGNKLSRDDVADPRKLQREAEEAITTQPDPQEAQQRIADLVNQAPDENVGQTLEEVLGYTQSMAAAAGNDEFYQGQMNYQMQIENLKIDIMLSENEFEYYSARQAQLLEQDNQVEAEQCQGQMDRARHTLDTLQQQKEELEQQQRQAALVAQQQAGQPGD